MRLIQITAGTGNYYCGSCLRDHALVRAIRDRGHDAILISLYLPLVTEFPEKTMTDRTDETPMFLGGINAFLQQKLPFFRHTPRWLDRILDTPALLRFAARGSGMTRPEDLGAMVLSTLAGLRGAQAKEFERFVTWVESRPRVDAVLLSNALLAGFAGPIQQRLDIPVFCTLQGEDSFLDALPLPYRDQAWESLSAHAAQMDHFIAVSGYHGNLMAQRLGLRPDRWSVAHNGIDVSDAMPRGPELRPPAVGFLAQMLPGKGLETLVDAYIELLRRGSIPGLQLKVAGSLLGADRKFVDRLHDRLAATPGSRFSFHANISREAKMEFLASIDVMSVPALYGESFGLYVLEALAAGVPVVQPHHAAFPEILEATGGGILYDPEVRDALPDALESLLACPDRGQALGAAGRAEVLRNFTTSAMADRVLRVIEGTLPGARHSVARSAVEREGSP